MTTMIDSCICSSRHLVLEKELYPKLPKVFWPQQLSGFKYNIKNSFPAVELPDDFEENC